MLKVAAIIEALSPEDRRAVAYEIRRAYGGPLSDAERARRYRSNPSRKRHGNVTVERDESVMESVTERHGSVTDDRHETVTLVPPSALPLPAYKYPSGFSLFWSKYPKRVGKGAAYEKWQKLKLEKIAELIVLGLDRQLQYLEREGGKFTPLPATWLNQRRWEDEPPQHTDNGHVRIMSPENEAAARTWLGGGT